MSTAREAYNHVFDLLQQHHRLFRECIPLIASENIPSPAVREALTTDFGNRYAEGWPGERVYAGCRFIDQVEFKCIELMKKLYKAEFVDVRPISGVVANLVVYTAFTEPGDTMMALSIPAGEHITMGKKKLGGTAGAVHGLIVEYLPLDYKELTIDVDRAKSRIEKLVEEDRSPKLVMFGASVFPFPHPVTAILVHAIWNHLPMLPGGTLWTTPGMALILHSFFRRGGGPGSVDDAGDGVGVSVNIARDITYSYR